MQLLKAVQRWQRSRQLHQGQGLRQVALLEQYAPLQLLIKFGVCFS
jgi:hypothetical protein